MLTCQLFVVVLISALGIIAGIIILAVKYPVGAEKVLTSVVNAFKEIVIAKMAI